MKRKTQREREKEGLFVCFLVQKLLFAYTRKHTHTRVHTHTLMQLSIVPIPARSPTQRDGHTEWMGKSGRMEGGWMKWREERMERQEGERMEGFIGYMNGEGERQLQIYPAQQDA